MAPLLRRSLLRNNSSTSVRPLGPWRPSSSSGARTPRQLHSSRLRTSGPTRSATLGQFKMLCAVLVTAAHMIFMTGQYLAGAKLFAAPVDLAPVPDAVCRSGAQRLAWRARGTTSAWCTLAALQGTPRSDARSRVPLAPAPPLAPSPPRECSVAQPPRYQTPLPTAPSSTSAPPPRKAWPIGRPTNALLLRGAPSSA